VEPVQITAKVADTVTLRHLARQARLLEYDNHIPFELLDKLDSNGTHLLFPRPDGTGTSEPAPPNATGYRTVERKSYGLLDPISFEVYMKTRGQKEAATHKLDVSMQDVLKLVSLEDERTSRLRVKDGEHRGNR
jgi:hypothetical protein